MNGESAAKSDGHEFILTSLLVLYGSQTGKAEELALDVYNHCKTVLHEESEIDVNLYSLSEIDKFRGIWKRSLVVFVVATVGDAECSDSAKKFWEELNQLANQTEKTKSLMCCRFSIFSLGNSNYPDFAVFGQQLEERLLDLGAKELYKRGTGDDATSTETDFYLWLPGLMESISRIIPPNDPFMQEYLKPTKYLKARDGFAKMTKFTPNSSPKDSEPLPEKKEAPEILKVTPDFVWSVEEEIPTFHRGGLVDSPFYHLQLVKLKPLTESKGLVATDRLVLEATFRSKNETLKWQPGDSFGFIVGNSDFEVNLALKALRLEPKANFTVEKGLGLPSFRYSYLPEKITLFNLIKYYTNLRATPSKSILRLFAANSDGDDRLRLLNLCDSESDGYSRILERKLTILDILREYKSCCPPLEQFIIHVPNFVPRYFSALNIMNEKGELKVAFRVLPVEKLTEIERNDSQLLGVFTGFVFHIAVHRNLLTEKKISFSCRLKHENFFAFRKKSFGFQLTDDDSKPIIMIAAGTGITPFLAFLAQRQQAKKEDYEKVTEAYLFYAVRSKEELLYSEELSKYQSTKVLTQLYPCYSADKEQPKSRVTDAIFSNCEIFHEVMKKNGFIYVCGAPKNFLTDVRKAIVDAFRETNAGGDLSPEQYLKQIEKEEKRIICEYWR